MRGRFKNWQVRLRNTRTPRRVTLNVSMNGSPISIHRHTEPPRLPAMSNGMASEIEPLCVSCLLSCGLDLELHNRQTLDDVLEQIAVSEPD